MYTVQVKSSTLREGFDSLVMLAESYVDESDAVEMYDKAVRYFQGSRVTLLRDGRIVSTQIAPHRFVMGG